MSPGKTKIKLKAFVAIKLSNFTIISTV